MPLRCLQCENSDRHADRQRDRPITATLAAHARRGLNTLLSLTKLATLESGS